MTILKTLFQRFGALPLCHEKITIIAHRQRLDICTYFYINYTSCAMLRFKKRLKIT